MAHVPLIRAKARLYVKPEGREDFVQDCLVAVFANWRGFRNDGNYSGFTTWITWQIRSVTSNHRQKTKSLASAISQGAALHNTAPLGRRVGKMGGKYSIVRTSAPQEYSAAAREAIDHIPDGRSKDALFMRALGGSLKEIGSVLGVCHQRADQLIGSARFCLDGVAA
jgi:RNA polymerase sigma factor (sigma-70 family)